MMGGGGKDNANPVVRSVDKSSSKKKSHQKQLLGWSDLARISADPVVNHLHHHHQEAGAGGDSCCGGAHGSHWESPSYGEEEALGDPLMKRSPEDRAILEALEDTAVATHGTGVALLRKVGVVIRENHNIENGDGNESDVENNNMNVGNRKTMAPPSFFRPKEDQEAVGEGNSNNDDDEEDKEQRRDPIDADEIFEIIRNIQDPEHPLTLEQLAVVSKEQIEVFDVMDLPPSERKNNAAVSTVNIRFTPTVPHCSMATLIGLSMRVKLFRSLPPRFKVTVAIEPGTHNSESSVNKQLADKERVCAALENPHLLKVVSRCIGNGMTGNMH